MYSDYNVVSMWPRCIQPPVSGPTVLRSDRTEIIDPFMSLLSASKGLYDALNNEVPQDDKKMRG